MEYDHLHAKWVRIVPKTINRSFRGLAAERAGCRRKVWVLPDSRHLQTILQNCLDLVLMCSFAIHAHDGLRSTKTDEQPAAVLQLELESIYGNELGNLQATQCFWFRLEDHFFPGLTFAG